LGASSISSELDKRCRSYLKPTNDTWRVDETYVKVKNMIRKGQIKGADKGNFMGQISFINQIFGVVA